MPIDINDAVESYQSGTSGAGGKLVRKFTSTPGKVQKGASPEAQRAYEEAMKDPQVLKRRQTRLAKVSEAEMNAAMEAKGAAAYSAGTAAALPKWQRNVQPYFQELDRTVAQLPARGRDPVQNVMQRVAPIAKNLAELRKKQG